MRGEYIAPWRHRAMAVELPPRARRIRDRTVLVDVAHGTTSACAENTDFLDSAGDVGGNYLRVRGEYTCHACARAREWELPPRARRILGRLHAHVGVCGTTSACAENTICPIGLTHGPWNYLRVRGEYSWGSAGVITKAELPPRARRIPNDAFSLLSVVGTTSACAENTLRYTRENDSHWNYLRVRGEYSIPHDGVGYPPELPPRARRILAKTAVLSVRIGTTSACAENTATLIPPRYRDWNYLRVRGEYNKRCDSA